MWRIESARIVGALARYTNDFGLAEDVAQEALAEALQGWPRDGVPPNPAGWLFTVGRRRAIDAFRRRSALDERYAALAHGLQDGGVAAGGTSPKSQDPDVLWDPDAIGDDVLALLFIACHPVLSPEARVGLTLRVVGGLSSEEIARAFLVPVPTVQARITRAKKTLAAARVPFELPPAEQRRERLGGVLQVLYLIFGEGANATSGQELLRSELADEARRLIRVLAQLLPGEPEVYGLLALMELTAARFPARVGSDGALVLLEDQDRRRWDHAAIARGRGALAQAASRGSGLGPYGLQAAIASVHAAAASVSETDWKRIVLLYEALGRIAPSPVVDLNRAVAVSMAYGPQNALSIVEGLVAEGRLAGSHLLPSVQGELLARLGRTQEARNEFDKAARLCRNERERELLRTKAVRLK
ncbi:RNA polymerase sigma factor [Kineosporia sp. NBRC 101731]|uniref:RNA polymerase sigma factor n=1 Tax=Kineosporia sp. NBRC 101731 TaxID=3032199 RepID=UPI0024A2C0CC|nr:RNA polymerase sigma factor [Kineosporia sp. NBRC 101731]GLY33948.1 RNA polymerase sigma factor [Kineosporia sp. NBRC 101731]